MVRNKNLIWYAFMQEPNSSNLYYINVLGTDFAEDILKRLKSKNKNIHISSYTDLKEVVKAELMSKYWSRCEYEILVTNWIGKEMEQKIDVWFQLEPNLDRIVDYIMQQLRIEFEE